MKVIISVTNDLSTDNRVDKVCRSIQSLGWEVLLVGRELPGSLPLQRTYVTKRMRLWFKKGALFYAEYNFRLFFFLLFSKVGVFHSNDLDTLLANGLAAKLRRKPLIYDSHEYFLGVPEIQDSPLVMKVWRTVEQWFFHLPVEVFTVNDSIAGLYKKDYGRELKVMRNIPEKQQSIAPSSRAEFGLPEDKFILVLQGAGINVDRGSEEMLQTLELLDDSFLWLIIGNGDVVPFLKKEVEEKGLQQRVWFLPRMAYSEMMRYTRVSDIGLTLDKPTNINYLYSLPNKIFDYIRAGIPVFASDLPEVTNIVNTYQIGITFPHHDPKVMAELLLQLKNDPIKLQQLKQNTIPAAQELAWENEVRSLLEVYKGLRIKD